MILPWLSGIRGFSKAPITWLLIILNTVICIYTSEFQENTKANLEKFYDKEHLVKAQGEIYAEFINRSPTSYSDLITEISDMSISGQEDQTRILGRLALRDKDFLEQASLFQTEGDEVQLQYWKENFFEIKSEIEKDPVFLWGLSHRDSTVVKWITYQFLHGGWLHLLSNMWFLLIFGSVLEPIVGSALFLIFYLLSGFFAAGAFIEMSGISGVPLVGASGSVSGLMGAYVAMFWREKARFMYWLLPVKGYTGFIMLPTWMLLAVWGISDLAGYLGTIREFGGVAHAAHIGGVLHGLVLGLLFSIWRKPSSHSVLSHDSRL